MNTLHHLLFLEHDQVQTDPALSQRQFDVLLFLLRRALSDAEGDRGEDEEMYICSLSSRTIVFKGQLTSHQLSYVFI